MKIERLNENQMRILMSAQELIDRNVTMPELSKGTEKGRALFAELIYEMREFYDFEFDENFPVIVEVIPGAKSDLTIIITKTPRVRRLQSFGCFGAQPPSYLRLRAENVAVYSFAALDDAMDAIENFRNVSPKYDGVNALYKLEGKYYLIIVRDENLPENEFINAERQLSDYGKKADGSSIFRAHVNEHGELVLQYPIQKFSFIS